MARLLCDSSGVSQMQPLAFQTPSGVNQVCLFVSLFLLSILATWLTLSHCVEFWELFWGSNFATNLTSVATDNLQNKENVCILSYALQEPLRSS